MMFIDLSTKIVENTFQVYSKHKLFYRFNRFTIVSKFIYLQYAIFYSKIKTCKQQLMIKSKMNETKSNLTIRLK